MQLLDSGFLYALVNRKEQRHQEVKAASATISGVIYLPTVVITEAAYLVGRDLGSAAIADFVDMLVAGEFELLEPLESDLTRAAEVIRKYADSQIDLVDAVIVAMAERLNVVRILTIDARHFRLFRPKHCDAFELIP